MRVHVIECVCVKQSPQLIQIIRTNAMKYIHLQLGFETQTGYHVAAHQSG